MAVKLSEAATERIYRAILKRLIAGKSEVALLHSVQTRLSKDDAEKMLDRALKEYHDAKQAGRLIDLEHDLHFKFARRTTGRKIWGASLVLLGIVISAMGYLSAMPGETYTVPVGMIIVGIILFAGG